MACFNCNSQSLARCRLSNIFFNASEVKLKKICVAHIEVVPGVQAVADGGEICQPRTQPSPAAPRSVNSGQQTTLSG